MIQERNEMQTSSGLDRLDLEMKADQGEDEALEVLDKVVETPQTVRVLAGVYIHLGTKKYFNTDEHGCPWQSV
jgi:hypothetical protein